MLSHSFEYFIITVQVLNTFKDTLKALDNFRATEVYEVMFFDM